MSNTLFQKIVKETRGKAKSSTWYRNKIRQLTISNGYNLNPGKLLLDERVDKSKPKSKQDDNKLTYKLDTGRIYMFDYDPKYQLSLPVYDKFPMVYILKPTDTGFYGYNLHYLNIKRRLEFIKILKMDQVHALKGRVHQYIIDPKYMNGIFLEVGESEWEVACHLPIENFFSNINGIEMQIPKTVIWQKTERMQKLFYREKRIIKRFL